MTDATFIDQIGPVTVARRSDATGTRRGPSPGPRARDSREFRMIYIATYPVFLVAALVMRVLRLASGRRAAGSLFHETHELASSSIPYAFMG